MCEFLREAMKRFLREHQTGDIFEFITSTVILIAFCTRSHKLANKCIYIPIYFVSGKCKTQIPNKIVFHCKVYKMSL